MLAFNTQVLLTEKTYAIRRSQSENELEGKQSKPHEALFWEHEGSRAIRKGNWKAVAENNQAWELYNLADDRTENKNLAENHPKILQELITAHEVWSKK